MSAGLTQKQHRLLSFIREFIAEAGHAPTYRQMAQAMGTTPGNAHGCVDRLIASGALRRLPNQPCGLELAETAKTVPPDVADRLAGYCLANGVSLDDALRLAVSRFFGGAA